MGLLPFGAIPLARRVEKSKHVRVRLSLLNPDDVVRAQLSQAVELVGRQKQLVLTIARPFEKIPASEMEALHWLRLKYEVTTESGEMLAREGYKTKISHRDVGKS